MVWDAEYPWDVRVEKIALALTDAGHTVHLVARNRRNEPTTERLPEGTVHRLTPLRWAPASLNAASMFPAFFNPRWIRAIARTARDARADVILSRDLPLAIPAVLAGPVAGEFFHRVFDGAGHFVADDDSFQGFVARFINLVGQMPD